MSIWVTQPGDLYRSVITSDESDTLPLHSVKSVNVLLKIWVPDDSTIFNNRSHQGEISIASTCHGTVQQVSAEETNSGASLLRDF